MRGRVTKLLNIRTGSPAILPYNNPGYFKPGDSIEIADVVVGQSYKGNNVWYKLAAGGYVWSGGVHRADEALVTANEIAEDATTTLDLRRRLLLNANVSLDSNGEGAVIAVLDSGISHPSLAGRIILEKSFLNNEAPSDHYGHGTKVAGVIAADVHAIRSLCTQSKLINYRVGTSLGAVTHVPIVEALRELSSHSQTVDVVNMSFAIPSRTIREIQPFIDRLSERGTVVVVAAGNSNVINSSKNLKNVIRVGAVKPEKFQHVREQGLSGFFDCTFVDVPIPSIAMGGGSDSISQVSAYTALVSGIVTSFLKLPENQSLQGENRFIAAKRFLSESSFSISQAPSSDEFKPFKP